MVRGEGAHRGLSRVVRIGVRGFEQRGELARDTEQDAVPWVSGWSLVRHRVRHLAVEFVVCSLIRVVVEMQE